MRFASTVSHGLFPFFWLHGFFLLYGAWMSKLRIPGASAVSLAGLLTLWAIAIAIWKPQPIHMLEIYQIEGGSQLIQAMKRLDAAEPGHALLHLQKHLQQINPNTSIHRIKIRVTQRNADRPNQEVLRAILAVEADRRLELGRLQDALRGWNNDSETTLRTDSSDPLADKQKRWAAWKRDIANHQLMLLSASVDRPHVRKVASTPSLASYQTPNGSPELTTSTESPEQQWMNLLEESSKLLPGSSQTESTLVTPDQQETVVCRSAIWHPVAGPVRFDRLLAAIATPLLLWATYRWLLQLGKYRATRSRGPWTRSLQSMGLLSLGRLECEENNAWPPKSPRNWNLGRAAGWWLEASFYVFPILVLTKAILNPTWGRFFFSQPIAALTDLLTWW
jgi:hypothetical protein